MELFCAFSDNEIRRDATGKKALSSSHGLTRSFFLLEGLKFEVGSTEEMLAIRAYQDRRILEYNKLLLVVNAIVAAGNNVAASLSGGQPPGYDKLQELLQSVKGLLLPEFSEDTEEKARKLRKIMEEEAAKGPMKVESMVYKKRDRKGFN